MKSRYLRTACFVTLLVAVMARAASAAGVTIAWNANDDTDTAGYIVRYGTAPRDYRTQVDVGLATTFKAEGLVAGQTYYFTVQAYATDGAVSATASELPAMMVGAVRPSATAHLLQPHAGQRDVTSAQIFSWEAVPQAEAYVFQIGTTPGARDVVDSGETRRTWWSAPSLPANARLFARVRTRVGHTWTSNEMAFTTAPTARLVYPYDTASDVSAHERFVWSAVTGADAYRLVVGTTAGAQDIADSGETTATAWALRDLQPGQTLYAQVATRIAGVWTRDAVTFTTATTARFTRPMATEGADLGRGLAWTTILGAAAYRVRLGTTAGAQDLLDSGDTLRTELETPALPAGQPIYAQVATHFGGQWAERTLTLTLAGAALIAPAVDASGASRAAAVAPVFTWTTITNAEAYILTVGTEPGATDVVNSGELQATSFEAARLPAGRPLYVSVWTKANGVWNGTASTIRVP